MKAQRIGKRRRYKSNEGKSSISPPNSAAKNSKFKWWVKVADKWMSEKEDASNGR